MSKARVVRKVVKYTLATSYTVLSGLTYYSTATRPRPEGEPMMTSAELRRVAMMCAATSAIVLAVAVL